MYHLIGCDECFNDNNKIHKLVCIFHIYYNSYDKLNNSQVKNGFKILNLLDVEANKTMTKEYIVTQVKLYNHYNNSDEYNDLLELLDDIHDTKKIMLDNIIDLISNLINSDTENIKQLYESYKLSVKNYKMYMLNA